MCKINWNFIRIIVMPKSHDNCHAVSCLNKMLFSRFQSTARGWSHSVFDILCGSAILPYVWNVLNHQSYPGRCQCCLYAEILQRGIPSSHSTVPSRSHGLGALPVGLFDQESPRRQVRFVQCEIDLLRSSRTRNRSRRRNREKIQRFWGRQIK